MMRHPLPRHINFTCSLTTTVLAREKVRPSVHLSAWGTCELRDFSKTAVELDGRRTRRKREEEGTKRGKPMPNCPVRTPHIHRARMDGEAIGATGVAESMTTNNLDARDDDVLPETEKALLLIELHSATAME